LNKVPFFSYCSRAKIDVHYRPRVVDGVLEREAAVREVGIGLDTRVGSEVYGAVGGGVLEGEDVRLLSDIILLVFGRDFAYVRREKLD
jgi:hypothetical protein